MENIDRAKNSITIGVIGCVATIVLGIIGIVLTIIFGVISLIR